MEVLGLFSKNPLVTRIVAGAVTLGCLFAFTPSAMAREPVFMSNLGGLPISCSIYASQAAVNGIEAGDSINKANAILGKPYSSSNRGGIIESYYSGIMVCFADYGGTGNYTAFSAKATGKNMKTLDGVAVGMTASVLSTTYGTADSVITERHTASKLPAEAQEKYAQRLDKTVYMYNANECLTMSFVVKNNVIVEIGFYQSE